MFYDFIDVFFKISIVYALMIITIVVMRISGYYKSNTDLKKIEFTQTLIDSKKESLLQFKIWNTSINGNSFIELDEQHFYNIKEKESLISEIYKLLNYFSTLADGVNKSIYHENVVRVNYENEIRNFMKYLRFVTRKGNLNLNIEESMFKIEFLLKRWEKEKTHKSFLRG